MGLRLCLIFAIALPTVSIHAVCPLPRPVTAADTGVRTIAPPDADSAEPRPEGPSASDPGTPGSPDPDGGLPPGEAAPSNGATAGPTRRAGACRPARKGPSYTGSWLLWWELNREHLLGLRTAMRGREAVSGDADPVAAYREQVRAALRAAIERPQADSVRAAALRALGRAGTDVDARRFLDRIEAKGAKSEIREGAAIGLGLLPKIQDPATRAEVRAFAGRLLDGRTEIPLQTQQVAMLALGMRARHDADLAARFAARARVPIRGTNRTAALFYALGLAADPVLGETLLDPVRTGSLGKRRLHDVARSHATLALARCGSPDTVDVLSRILGEKDRQAHTRRSATIGLGIVLRRDDLPDRIRKAAERTLARLLAEDRDPLVCGFAAVSLGNAKRPAGIDALIRVARGSGGCVEGPYAALALGLAARRLPESKAKKIRRFLATEHAKCRDFERTGALAIAAGVAGATEARALLLRRVATARTPLRIRALSAQALGLLGDRSAAIEKALRKVLEDGAPLVTENAAIALGMLGRSETAGLLVATLTETRSKALRTHMVIALTHLGGTRAISPLVEILAEGEADRRVLECAATVLGILVDPREDDPLFEIDASINAYGLTAATRNLVRAY